jgi:hypothetical protein
LNAFGQRERQFLSEMRGRFGDSREYRFWGYFGAILFGIATPALFTFAIFQHGLPRWPLSADQWACIVFMILGPLLGAFFWLSVGREYEFNGSQVRYWRRGTLRWEIQIDSITGWQVERVASARRSWLHFFVDGQRYSLSIFPSLADRAKDLTNRSSQPLAGEQTCT